LKRSLRITLTFWYVGIFAVILCLFGWVLYANVSINIARDIDELLILQADSVADTISAFWRAEKERHPSRPAGSGLEKEIQEGRFQDLINRWRKETDELAKMRFIRILERDGALLAASKNFSQLPLSLTETAVRQAQEGRTIYETYDLPDHRARLITRPVSENKHLLYIIQAATPLKQAEASLENMRLWIFLLIPLTVLATTTAGWLLTTSVLRPVDRMIRQAQRISAEQLHERIEERHTGDELDRLAVTFNSMLSRLERAFRRLRQFSAAASHELRTPLTIIKGELEVALRKSRSSEEYERVLRTQLEAVDDMTRIVEQLLLLAHSDEGGNETAWQVLDLSGLIQETCSSMQNIAQLKKIRLLYSQLEPLWIRGERLLLKRLTANLIDNAIKHTPPGGNIAVSLSRDRKEACLCVRDTGPGISPDELPKIFDKFFTQKTDASESRSTGLGLGLCRWIVELHQGSIEASSPPGQGAVLTVRLPLR